MLSKTLLFIAILVASKFSFACEQLASAKYHVERAFSYCVGCASSPYATEEWVLKEKRDALKRLVSTMQGCNLQIPTELEGQLKDVEDNLQAILAMVEAQAAEAARRQKAEQEKKDAQQRAQIAACVKRNRLSEAGVARIGMSSKDNILCGWGEPEDINRSIGRWGVHEQWVYGSRNYLYFENGRLTAIQN